MAAKLYAMKKNQSVITIFLIAMVAVFNFLGKPPETADPEFKNLQVLPKDISKEALDKVMDSFCEALDVKCGFCHVRNADTRKMEFEKDDNPHKEMARGMMKMTAAINQQYFNVDMSASPGDAQVTCFTCHGGSKHPLVAPEAEAIDSIAVSNEAAKKNSPPPAKKPADKKKQ